MQSHRPSAAAAVGKSHVCALHARARKLERAWCARACDLRANGRFDRAFVLRSANGAQRRGRID
eukprot:3563554-Lingulodinium_polyedra.AAC.1